MGAAVVVDVVVVVVVVVLELVDGSLANITKTFLCTGMGLAVVALSVASVVLLVVLLLRLCLCLRLPLDRSLDVDWRQGPLFKNRIAKQIGNAEITNLLLSILLGLLTLFGSAFTTSHLAFICEGYALSLMRSPLGSCTHGLVDGIALDITTVWHAVIEFGEFQFWQGRERERDQ